MANRVLMEAEMKREQREQLVAEDTYKAVRDDAIVLRFLERVQRGPCCHHWKGTISLGYGNFRFPGRRVRAHRFAWALAGNKLPIFPRMLDHTCRNKACVNPDHLQEVSNRENVLRGYYASGHPIRTHCPKGHEFNLFNVYEVAPGRGTRGCLVCRKASRASERNRKYQKEYRKRNKERLNAQSRAYHHANRERRLEKMRQWWADNRAK